MIMQSEIELTASSVSRQKRVTLKGVPTDRTVGELLDGVLIKRLQLPRKDSEGRNVNFTLRRERDGVEVRRSDTIGESLRHGDHIVVQPKINAGGAPR